MDDVQAHNDAQEPAEDSGAPSSKVAASKLAGRPRGWLSKIFGRHAPLWVKLVRTPLLAMTALFTIDAAVLPHMPGRPLTRGEKEMLHEVYGDSINYPDVRIHQSQATDMFLHYIGADGITKGNVIYLTSDVGGVDVAASTDSYNRYVFVHEGGHVWQGQNGLMPNAFVMFTSNFHNLLPGGGKDHADYRYTLVAGKDLTEYNIEQQASIITEDFFGAQGSGLVMFNHDGTDYKQLKQGYDGALKNFRANPAYPRNR